MKLKVLIRSEIAGGYSASVPAFPGCYSEGDTLDDALANIREAAELWLEVTAEAAQLRAIEEGASAEVQEIVPVHGNKDLRTGTQRGIMKDAGLTDDDL